MFPRSKRVSREDFPKLLSSRKRLFSAHFSITLSDTTKGFAAVVAKRVAPTSVARHKLKRRMLAVLHSIDTLPASGAIIFAKSGAPTLSYTAIRAELKSLLV